LIFQNRSVNDRRTVKNSAAGKAFTSLVYSADGRCILAGGSSKYVCIYETKSKMLVKKFVISSNLSLDGVREQLSNRDMTEAGPLALIDDDNSDEEAEDRQREKDKLRLPGVQRQDLSVRKTAPAIRTFGVRFAPTGRAFACAGTEGLLIYALDDFLLFDPMDLELELTPQAVADAVSERSWLKAIVLALRLNEEEPLEQAYLSIPPAAVPAVAKELPLIYVEGFLKLLVRNKPIMSFLFLLLLLLLQALQVDKQPYLEFHLLWLREILGTGKGPFVRTKRITMAPTLRALQKAVIEKRDGLSKTYENN